MIYIRCFFIKEFYDKKMSDDPKKKYKTLLMTRVVDLEFERICLKRYEQIIRHL